MKITAITNENKQPCLPPIAYKRLFEKRKATLWATMLHPISGIFKPRVKLAPKPMPLNLYPKVSNDTINRICSSFKFEDKFAQKLYVDALTASRIQQAGQDIFR